MDPSWLPVYAVLAAVQAPIVGAYDYGTYPIDVESLWFRVIVSVILATLVTVVGETALYVVRRHRRH